MISAGRRLPLDERICIICGNTFLAKRYRFIRSCSKRCAGFQSAKTKNERYGPGWFSKIERKKRTSPSALSRFARKVEIGVSCWTWIGSKTKNGYGQLAVRDPKRTVYAHRFSYELFVGPIPAGYHVDHLCSNQACVNPKHLEAVTPAENTRRYWAKVRSV